MHGIRIRAARQWFRRFAKLRMNSTQPAFIQKHARTIGLMVQSKVFAMSNDQWAIINDAVSRRPFLFINTFLFVSRNDNLMFPAAAATIVTTPVLQNRKYDAGLSHNASIRRSSQLYNLDVLRDLSIHEITVAISFAVFCTDRFLRFTGQSMNFFR